jgi:hypothetical protein
MSQSYNWTFYVFQIELISKTLFILIVSQKKVAFLYGFIFLYINFTQNKTHSV